MKATDKVVDSVLDPVGSNNVVLSTDPILDPVGSTNTQTEALEAMDVTTLAELSEVGATEVLVYAVSAVTEDLLQAKINVEASDCVLKSQICTLLDQAIQASLVK